ncbi:hypothetical protein [Gluconacetobacter diazotrophicus]|uniref:hypothetical protein n=1 Tax=Gluconacetobacter diazotrophicus TaxID=33996 RepID=UPI00059CAD5E|nr:hypothetical protein [Gluconacetobacter diazotrophicus]
MANSNNVRLFPGVPRTTGIDGGGGPPHDSDMNHRVTALESKFDGIKDTLNAIQVTLTRIETTMATKDSMHAIEVRTAVLEERTGKLATTRSMSIMVGLAVAILTLAARWNDVVAHFTHP